MSCYALYTRVYLNQLTQQYETIMTIDRLPVESSALRDMVRTVRIPTLSPFQPRGRYGCSPCHPTYALKSLCDYGGFGGSGDGAFMSPVELPQLFSLLVSSGYRVDTEVTQMLNGRGGGRAVWGSRTDEDGSACDLVCFVSFTAPVPAPAPVPVPAPSPHQHVHSSSEIGVTTTTTTTTTTTRADPTSL